MNSSNNPSLERAKTALATLRPKVEAVIKIAPNLMEINSLDELSKEKPKVVESQLWLIFAYGEYYVAKVMSDLSEPMFTVANKKNFDWYNNKYKPFSEKMRELIDVSDAPTRKQIEIEIISMMRKYHESEDWEYLEMMISQSHIDHHMDQYKNLALGGWLLKYIKILIEGNIAGRRAVSIYLDQCLHELNSTYPHTEKKEFKTALEVAVEVAGHYLEGLLHSDPELVQNWYERGLDLSACDEILNKLYFNPCDWVDNEQALGLIPVTWRTDRIPPAIYQRVKEINRSFIFGNWMAVIVMSRTLLEYALMHVLSLKKINIKDEEGNLHTLLNLIDIAISEFSEEFSETKNFVDTIRKNGNKVAHPKYKHDLGRQLILQRPPGKGEAQESLDAINKVISALYSQ